MDNFYKIVGAAAILIVALAASQYLTRPETPDVIVYPDGHVPVNVPPPHYPPYNTTDPYLKTPDGKVVPNPYYVPERPNGSLDNGSLDTGSKGAKESE